MEQLPQFDVAIVAASEQFGSLRCRGQTGVSKPLNALSLGEGFAEICWY